MVKCNYGINQRFYQLLGAKSSLETCLISKIDAFGVHFEELENQPFGEKVLKMGIFKALKMTDKDLL